MSEGEVKALRLAVEERHVLVVVAVLKVLDDSLRHHASLGVEGKAEVLVLQRYVLCFAL